MKALIYCDIKGHSAEGLITAVKINFDALYVQPISVANDGLVFWGRPGNLLVLEDAGKRAPSLRATELYGFIGYDELVFDEVKAEEVEVDE